MSLTVPFVPYDTNGKMQLLAEATEDIVLVIDYVSTTVGRLLFGILNPLDVQEFTPEEFDETASAELSLAWIIGRQARRYYWCKKAKKPSPITVLASHFRYR